MNFFLPFPALRVAAKKVFSAITAAQGKVQKESKEY
jgi:hypothetical protein